MRKLFLIFDIETTKYLGTPSRMDSALNILQRLPGKYEPTRCKGPDFSTAMFRWQNRETFLRMIPGGNPFQGSARIYKTRSIFEFEISWAKGTRDWFADHPAMRFNSLGLQFRDGETIVRSPDLLDPLVDIWLELCALVEATHGYVYLDSCTGYEPRGEGYCLPRLHWLTFFGREYVELLHLRQKHHIDGADVRGAGSGVMLRIQDNPARLVKPSPVEWAIIEQLERRAFWGHEADDWRAPTKSYLQPEFDWTEILTDKTAWRGDVPVSLK